MIPLNNQNPVRMTSICCVFKPGGSYCSCFTILLSWGLGSLEETSPSNRAGNSINLNVEGRNNLPWERLDNWSLPPFRYCIILRPHSRAKKMSQVCAERRNMNCGSQQSDMWRCGKEPTQQLCFPSSNLGESRSFLPAPCPGMTQARACRHHTALFPSRKARQT